MMFSGVVKSGSPIENETMSMPSDFIWLTRFDIAIVPEAGIS